VKSLRRLAMMAVAAAAALLAPLTAGAATSPSTWTVMPAQPDATADFLNGVACPSVSFCLATGASGPIPLTFEWNGSTWSLTQSSIGEPDETELSAVSCASPSFCVAVGSNFLGFSHGTQAAAWVWNGTNWSEMTASSPSMWNHLDAVKCLSPADCEAVGDQSAHMGYGFHVLAEAWNGSTWRAQPVRGPNGPVTGTLNAVACASGSSCEAVGQHREHSHQVGLAARWNGTGWSAQKLPAVTGLVDMSGVSCYRAGCTAVGRVLTATGHESTLAEAWNGSRWSLQSPIGSGDVAGATDTTWNALHCGSATNCTVAGSWRDAANNTFTLAETWNGSRWAKDTTPSPSSGGTTATSLNAMSCTPGTRVCTAIGYGGSNVVFGIRN
jgi:hypothetical protein